MVQGTMDDLRKYYEKQRDPNIINLLAKQLINLDDRVDDVFRRIMETDKSIARLQDKELQQRVFYLEQAVDEIKDQLTDIDTEVSHLHGTRGASKTGIVQVNVYRGYVDYDFMRLSLKRVPMINEKLVVNGVTYKVIDIVHRCVGPGTEVSVIVTEV